jgi:hypothetical protein
MNESDDRIVSIEVTADETAGSLIAMQGGSLLVKSGPLPLDQNPAAVYLAHLTPGGQRTMCEALNKIAAMLTGGQANALTCQWSALRFQHTAAVRARLAATYKPATANRIICALRGTLKMAWRLGQMSAEDYHRAADIPAVRGETVPAGRELHVGEISALIMACQKDATPAGARAGLCASLTVRTHLNVDDCPSLPRRSAASHRAVAPLAVPPVCTLRQGPGSSARR